MPTQNNQLRSGEMQGDVNISEERAAYWERNLRGEAREIWEEDQKYFVHQALSTPVLDVIGAANGACIEDLYGKKYIDMHGNGVHNVGFNNPQVIEAVIQQLKSGLTFCPRRYTNRTAVNLAKKLAEIAPGNLNRSLFCPGGSEAIEMALALARRITGRFKVIGYKDSFHGATIGAADAGGQEHFRSGLSQEMTGVRHIEFPDYNDPKYASMQTAEIDEHFLRELEDAFEAEGDVAAVIGEPVTAEPRVPTKAYWEGVRALCDRHGAFLIFDEVIEGFGRTGKMFACEHFVEPDVLVLGKSLGGGLLPFAGIVTREQHNIVGDRSIGHYTHEKNALCAAAALATIQFIEDNHLIDHAKEIGKRALDRLKKMAIRQPLVFRVAGLGLHLGIELRRSKSPTEPAAIEAEKIMYKCMEQGVAFKTISGNHITLRPALTITEEQMNFAIDTIETAIEEVESEAR